MNSNLKIEKPILDESSFSLYKDSTAFLTDEITFSLWAKNLQVAD